MMRYMCQVGDKSSELKEIPPKKTQIHLNITLSSAEITANAQHSEDMRSHILGIAH